MLHTVPNPEGIKHEVDMVWHAPRVPHTDGVLDNLYNLCKDRYNLPSAYPNQPIASSNTPQSSLFCEFLPRSPFLHENRVLPSCSNHMRHSHRRL